MAAAGTSYATTLTPLAFPPSVLRNGQSTPWTIPRNTYAGLPLAAITRLKRGWCVQDYNFVCADRCTKRSKSLSVVAWVVLSAAAPTAHRPKRTQPVAAGRTRERRNPRADLGWRDPESRHDRLTLRPLSVDVVVDPTVEQRRRSNDRWPYAHVKRSVLTNY
jgi:hypothetical protein